MRTTVFAMISAAVASLVLSQSLSDNGNVVRLDVYMEAQCPDTNRFVHNQLMPVWNQFGQTGRVEWNLIPFGKAKCDPTPDGADYVCTCQHGANECILNQLQSCVIEALQQPEQFMETISCIQSKPDLDAALNACIAPVDSLDVDQMQQCASGAHGRNLLAEAGLKTVALSARLTFVPWIVLNGNRVSDALYDLKGNICKLLDPVPAECA